MSLLIWPCPEGGKPKPLAELSGSCSIAATLDKRRLHRMKAFAVSSLCNDAAGFTRDWEGLCFELFLCLLSWFPRCLLPNGAAKAPDIFFSWKIFHAELLSIFWLFCPTSPLSDGWMNGWMRKCIYGWMWGWRRDGQMTGRRGGGSLVK